MNSPDPTTVRIAQSVYQIRGKPVTWKYVLTNDAQYVLDHTKGPILRVMWKNPGFFGKPEFGDFVFRTQCGKIGVISDTDTPKWAKEAAVVDAGRGQWKWARFGGPVGAVVGAAVTVAKAHVARESTDGQGLKAIGVYYDIGFGIELGPNVCFAYFVAVAKREIIDEILAHFRTDRIFEYK